MKLNSSARVFSYWWLLERNRYSCKLWEWTNHSLGRWQMQGSIAGKRGKTSSKMQARESLWFCTWLAKHTLALIGLKVISCDQSVLLEFVLIYNWLYYERPVWNWSRVENMSFFHWRPTVKFETLPGVLLLSFWWFGKPRSYTNSYKI